MRMPLTQVLPQLPGMFDTPWPSNVFVPTKNDHGAEAVMRRLVGVAQAELQRMLAREKRDDMLARQVGPEIRHEMAKIVLFLGPHRAVGDHHAHVLPGERANRMIGVDPGVDPFGGLQFGAWRAELDGNDRRLGCAKEREIRSQLIIEAKAGLKPGPSPQPLEVPRARALARAKHYFF